jgi:hypothetical protein
MVYKGKLRWENGLSFIETEEGERLVEEMEFGMDI